MLRRLVTYRRESDDKKKLRPSRRECMSVGGGSSMKLLNAGATASLLRGFRFHAQVESFP